MRNLINRMKASDKMLHIAVSALCYLCFAWYSMVAGVAVTVGVGLWKEYIHDRKQKKGEFDKYDMVADLLGLAAGITIGCIWKLFAR